MKANTGQRAYDITCNFASTGTLGARQLGNLDQLSYVLHNNVIEFRVTTPDACTLGVCVGVPRTVDPRFSVTFDTEFEVSLGIPDSPCAVQVKGAAVYTHNAIIDSQNFTGDVVKEVLSLVSDGTFPSAEATLDSQMQAIQLNLNDTLNSLASSCDSARQQGLSNSTRRSIRT